MLVNLIVAFPLVSLAYAPNVNILNEGFESGSFAQTVFTAGYQGDKSSITNAQTNIITGGYSVYSQIPVAAGVWTEILYSDITKLIMEKGTTYKVSFNYKIIENSAEGGFCYFMAKSPTENDGVFGKGYNTWTGVVGNSGSKSFELTLSSATPATKDYHLIWGMNGGGGLSIDDIKIEKIVSELTYGFETGEDTASCFWMPQGSAFNNSNSSKVITGNYSFYSESESAWEQMLSSIPATLPMKPNTTYRYSYDYLVDKSPGADTFFIIVRSGGDYPLGVLFSQWNDTVGNKGNKTFEFTTNNFNDYYILLGAQTGGAICYDNLKLEEKNVDDSYTTVSNVGFETGGLPAAYWNPSVNCSFIHSNTEAIIAGQYSYFANISSSGFVDCLQSDNSNLQLLPNTSYTISFKYNIERNAGSFFYFYTRNGLGQTIGFNQWDVSDSGNSGIKTYIFNTSNATDTWLTWGVVNSGAFSIDDISIYETLIPTTINNYTVSTDGGNIITGVLPGKTLADFMTGVTVGNHTNILTTDYNGTVITNNYVGTGTTIAVTQNNTTINYKIVIYGEVNGDGLIDVSDLVLIKNHILRINTLNEQFIKAGDVFLKGNISISDFLAVKKHILQIDVINQNP